MQQYYKIRLTGETPLLLHNDNLEWADSMKEWAKDPKTKRGSVAGDDRSPAWRWIGALYVGEEEFGMSVVMPSDNLMTMLREGGKQCPTGSKGKTFKARTQSGIVIEDPHWSLTIEGASVPYAPIKSLIGVDDFNKHQETCKELGFELLVKRATVGQSKHVRVRPWFKKWEVSGKLLVIDDLITKEVLQNILTFAGAFTGLGDWRPGSPRSPGQHGRFTATVDVL